jgi:hypothetical protein
MAMPQSYCPLDLLLLFFSFHPSVHREGFNFPFVMVVEQIITFLEPRLSNTRIYQFNARAPLCSVE